MNNYVVSDIHGNAERLEALLFLLRRKHPVGDYKLYVLGDLFDRGDESQKVLSIVLENPGNIEVLKGNHEWLFMKFMESPVKNYMAWQMNFSYSTIMSFIDNEKDVLFEKYADKTDEELQRDCYDAYVALSQKLKKKFGKFDGDHKCESYINTITKTVSSRDIRNVSQDYNYLLNEHLLKDKSSEYIKAFANLTYINLVDSFCNVYDYFGSLKPYSVVDDKFLLVHSGFVNVNKNPHVEDSISFDLYEYCETVGDLEHQNEYPMLWARRKSLRSEKSVPPMHTFDGKVIVYGHTTTDHFNATKNDLSAYFYYNEFGNLISIGIDGCNCERNRGQMNCLRLDDLSQIVIKGTNFAYNSQPKGLKVEEIEYQPTQGPSFN